VNISEPFIRRPAMTTLLTVSAIVFGVMCYFWLPVNDLPAVDYPVIQVQANYPGASPETMANNIATPLERQFMQISGLDIVTSQSTEGHTSISLQFNLDKSIDAAATDVQTAITQASGNLPVDLPSPPTFQKTNPNDQAIVYVAMTSDSMPAGKLYDFATGVQQQISILSGVSRVDIYGTKSAIRIKADPEALASRNLALTDLSTAIANGTGYEGAGQLDGTHMSMLLQPKGQLETAEDYGNLIIGGTSNSPIRLKDVATVVDSVQDERIHMQFWERDVKTLPTSMVVLAVFRQAGANAVDVARSVYALKPVVQAELPPSIQIVPVYDRSANIVRSVLDVEKTLMIAFILVVIVIFMFLGRARDTIIPTFALPMSMLLTFIVMNALGYSLDNLSLMALTLAIGFLVDDAIVFLENTVRRMEKLGEGAMEASFNSAREISFTILSMTVSLAAVFIPLVFMPGLIGRIFREFSITIIVSIFASGIVSLTLTPLMCSRLLARRGHGVTKTWVERVIGGVEHRVLGFYGTTLSWFLRNKWISAVIWICCLIGTVVLFQRIPKSLLPTGDSGFLLGVLIAQEGSSPQQMHEYQARTDAVLHAPDSGVTISFTMSGNGSFVASNQEIMLAFLGDPSTRSQTIDQIAAQLSGKMFMGIPGTMSVMLPQPVLQLSTGVSSRTQGSLSFAISGIKPEDVYQYAAQLQTEFSKFRPFGPDGPPGFAGRVLTDLYNHTPGLDIPIRHDQAATYNVSPKRILDLLSHAYSQNYVYLIKRPTDQYEVILEAADKDRSIPENLSQLYIRSDDGSHIVPLSALVDWKPSLGPQSVNHLNQFTSVTFSFTPAPGVPTSAAVDFIQQTAARVLPPQIRGQLQGDALTYQQTKDTLTILMFLAVFVMYVILGILYESYVHPITVLSSLPVALVGGLATLVLFGQEASLYAFIGMFMLMGIVKKNGIMIVDFALQRIDQGQSAEDAIHQASMDRFRPIIMTTLAALMGAIPIALGIGADAASRRPLGLVIIGGLVVSQFITLYITPVIYLYLEWFQEHVLDRTSFFRSSRVFKGALPFATAVRGANASAAQEDDGNGDDLQTPTMPLSGN